MHSVKVLFLAKVMPNFSVGGLFNLVLKFSFFSLYHTSTMHICTCIVGRFMEHATAEIFRNNMTEIRCPCRRCKLKSLIADPDSGQVRDHLLLRGFMDGYRWQGDEDDYEVVHGGRARNEEGQQDNHRGSGGGGEKTKNPEEMITTVMLYTVIM